MNKYINKIKVYVCLYIYVEVENLIIMMLVFVHSVYKINLSAALRLLFYNLQQLEKVAAAFLLNSFSCLSSDHLNVKGHFPYIRISHPSIIH